MSGDWSSDVCSSDLHDSKDDMRSVYYNLSIENIALDIFNNNITDIVLSDSDMSFSQMLDIMDMFSDKGINFHIHTLKSNTVISSNCAVITINKVMERTSDYQLSENIITETAFRNAD